MISQRACDAQWYAKLPRAKLSDKKCWTAMQCLITQRRESGIAPVVLECGGAFFRTPSSMYDASFELCLRHLHKQSVPLGEACNVQQLLENRVTHALNLPGRYVPAVDGSVSTLMPPEAEAEAEAEASPKTTDPPEADDMPEAMEIPQTPDTLKAMDTPKAQDTPYFMFQTPNFDMEADLQQRAAKESMTEPPEANDSAGELSIVENIPEDREAEKAPEADPPETVHMHCFVLQPRTLDMQDILPTPPTEEPVTTPLQAENSAQHVAEEGQRVTNPATMEAATISCASAGKHRHREHNARWGYHTERHAEHWKKYRPNGRHRVWQPRRA